MTAVFSLLFHLRFPTVSGRRSPTRTISVVIVHSLKSSLFCQCLVHSSTWVCVTADAVAFSEGRTAPRDTAIPRTITVTNFIWMHLVYRKVSRNSPEKNNAISIAESSPGGRQGAPTVGWMILKNLGFATRDASI